MISKLRFTFNGGLGNQIFQYLASLYLREQLGVDRVEYCSSAYIRQGYRDLDLLRLVAFPLELQAPIPHSLPSRFASKITRKLNHPARANLWPLFCALGFRSAYLDEGQFHSPHGFNSLQELSLFLKQHSLAIDKVHIDGYWQYPSTYLHRLSDWSVLFDGIRSFLPPRWRDVHYVTIHIRRGDYLNQTEYSSYFSKFHPIQYLQNALQLVPSEFKSFPIVVVTDDQSWADFHMRYVLNDWSFFISSSSDPLVDWALLVQSSFSIISNSTYSFTAAMLNRQSMHNHLRVIMPQWLTSNESTVLKGWNSLPGAIVI